MVITNVTTPGTIAIVGGGFSGTLLAINLLRHDGPRAILIEAAPRLARGVAFDAAHPAHLLNVRAANMSALPDDPGHFARWLAARRGGVPGDFAQRRDYGDYLAEQLAAAQARAGARLQVIHGRAMDATLGDHIAVRLDDGGSVTADALVLALGNLPPHPPHGFDPAVLGDDVYAGNPWAGDIGEGLGAGDAVLLCGTGLTMVDAALLLDARGFSGRIVALSRRGLIPHPHADVPPAAALTERPDPVGSSLLARVRADAAAIGWRGAVDRLRPVTQSLWLAADTPTRARFLRHLRPWWDVHRHRLAPAVAARLALLRESGRLTVVAGKTIAARPDGDGARVQWRARGTDRVETLTVRRIVNCTGPAGDLARAPSPLLRALIGRGTLRPDAHRLGLDVDVLARTIAADGSIDGRLYAVGPMTRGAFWEIGAVPDIRVQSWTLARRLSNAQWVGGEGL